PVTPSVSASCPGCSTSCPFRPPEPEAEVTSARAGLRKTPPSHHPWRQDEAERDGRRPAPVNRPSDHRPREAGAWVARPSGPSPGSAGNTLQNGGWAAPTPSDVVVEVILHGVRAQADGVDLLLLGVDPGADDVLGEDVALEEEALVLLERVQRLFEVGRHLRDAAQLLRREPVDVLVHRLTRVDAVLDPVQARHQ